MSEPRRDGYWEGDGRYVLWNRIGDGEWIVQHGEVSGNTLASADGKWRYKQRASAQKRFISLARSESRR